MTDDTFYATIRVMAEDDDDELDYDRCMEFEYSNDDHDLFMDYLTNRPAQFPEWKYEGNAFCVEAKDRKDVAAFQEFIKTKYPKENIGIEWDYWIDD